MCEPSERVDVSVVIPAYNAATTIAAQLQALDRQSLTGEWEIIIALQPCTDGTEAVIALCANPRVRVVEAHDRLGPSYARNVGVAAARAPLIAFCDADDIAADNWLAELVRYSLSPVVAGGVIRFDDPAELDVVSRSSAVVPGTDYEFLQSVYTNNLLVHRVAFEAVGGFDVDLSHCEDTDLAWRLQLAGYRIATAPDAIVYYRQRASGRDKWLQFHRWCRAAPTLYRRYRVYGMPRTAIRKAARDWLWLATRLPLIVRPVHRRIWLRRSARRTGHLVGSVRERCLYL